MADADQMQLTCGTCGVVYAPADESPDDHDLGCPARMDLAETLDRYPVGRVEAPERYIEYEGQVIVRTRHETSQRWIKEGWNPGRMGDLPYLLGERYCQPADDGDQEQDAMNDHLATAEVEVYYVEDGETVHYRVENTET